MTGEFRHVLFDRLWEGIKMNKNEIKLKEANSNDVDLILDMKLDILLNKPYSPPNI